MRPGEIRVEGASRRFRVHAQEARTLKDLVIHGRSKAREVWALNDVSFHVEPGGYLSEIARFCIGLSGSCRSASQASASACMSWEASVFGS